MRMCRLPRAGALDDAPYRARCALVCPSVPLPRAIATPLVPAFWGICRCSLLTQGGHWPQLEGERGTSDAYSLGLGLCCRRSRFVTVCNGSQTGLVADCDPLPAAFDDAGRFPGAYDPAYRMQSRCCHLGDVLTAQRKVDQR